MMASVDDCACAGWFVSPFSLSLSFGLSRIQARSREPVFRGQSFFSMPASAPSHPRGPCTPRQLVSREHMLRDLHRSRSAYRVSLKLDSYGVRPSRTPYESAPSPRQLAGPRLVDLAAINRRSSGFAREERHGGWRKREKKGGKRKCPARGDALPESLRRSVPATPKATFALSGYDLDLVPPRGFIKRAIYGRSLFGTLLREKFDLGTFSPLWNRAGSTLRESRYRRRPGPPLSTFQTRESWFVDLGGFAASWGKLRDSRTGVRVCVLRGTCCNLIARGYN